MTPGITHGKSSQTPFFESFCSPVIYNFVYGVSFRSLILRIGISFHQHLLVFCQIVMRIHGVIESRSYRWLSSATESLCIYFPCSATESLCIYFPCSLGSPPGWPKKINWYTSMTFLPLFEPAGGSITVSLSISLRTRSPS